MTIIERIQDNFNKGYFGKSMPIDELPEEYPAWTLKHHNWVGVAVPLPAFSPFSEDFAHMKIEAVKDVVIGETAYDILMITCDAMEMRNEFATVCANFVDPGTQGNQRSKLISNPAVWWKHWKDLLGNVSLQKEPYDILGELITYEKVLMDQKETRWSGIEFASHDIENDNYSVEVKSTVKRYEYEVIINSIYQLVPAPGKPLFLSFIRLEASMLGQSIDEVVGRLKKLGVNHDGIEAALAKVGLEPGRIARNKKYKIIEWKKYSVNDMFPSVTESSFKNNCLPPHIVRFSYTVNLAGIEGENLLNNRRTETNV